ncbi:MAG: hypothetical protein ACQEWR_02765 [Bacillota bacterium]
MSASKDLYASMGWSQKVLKEDRIFEVEQRFTINDGSKKIFWEFGRLLTTMIHRIIYVLKS